MCMHVYMNRGGGVEIVLIVRYIVLQNSAALYVIYYVTNKRKYYMYSVAGPLIRTQGIKL